MEGKGGFGCVDPLADFDALFWVVGEESPGFVVGFAEIAWDVGVSVGRVNEWARQRKTYSLMAPLSYIFKVPSWSVGNFPRGLPELILNSSGAF